MARFEKGNKKATGRPAGKPNKTTEQLREFWQLLLEKNEERIAQELGALEGKDFLDAVFKMTEYVIPKLQRMEVGNTESDKGFQIQVTYVNKPEE